MKGTKFSRPDAGGVSGVGRFLLVLPGTPWALRYFDIRLLGEDRPLSSKQKDPAAPREEATGSEAEAVVSRPRQVRYRTIRFVVFFAVLVLAMLTGYRYAMNTEANMWYLFQVARSTAWTLDVVGQRGEVEPDRLLGTTQRIRAELAEWRGETLVDGESTAGSVNTEPPLTAWESWLHKAYSHMNAGGSLETYGPTVYFVAKQGLTSRKEDLHKELTLVTNNKDLEAEVRESEMARLEAVLKEVDAEEAALPEGDAGRRARRDVQFRIKLVPDCGAIPSISIFLAAVIAFPTLIVHRFIGVIAGTMVLYAINVGRLATLMYIGAIDTKSGGKWFTFIHEYVWQGIFLIFVVAVWMAWIEFVVRERRA